MGMEWSSIAGCVGALVALPALWWCYRTLVGVRPRSSLQNQVVVITGASSGLGEACAKVFYQCGCRVILAGRSVERLNAVKDALMKLKTPTSGVPEPAVLRMDLEDVGGVQGAAVRALEVWGRVDVVVNNAGMSYRGCVHNTHINVDHKLMAVNYLGHVAFIKGLLPSMVSQGGGHIVGISSIQGKISIPYRSAYSASKHAFQAFFDCLRAEMADSNIEVTLVSPGYIRTNLSTNAICGDGSTYGVMDRTTQSGMAPEAVAERVVQCVLQGGGDLTLAPLLHRLALLVRALAPPLFFSLMARRARAQRKDYAQDKKDH